MDQIVLSKYKEAQTGKDKYCVSVGREIKCKGMDMGIAVDMADKLGGGTFICNTKKNSKVSGRIVNIPEIPKPVEEKKIKKKEDKKPDGKDK